MGVQRPKLSVSRTIYLFLLRLPLGRRMFFALEPVSAVHQPQPVMQVDAARLRRLVPREFVPRIN